MAGTSAEGGGAGAIEKRCPICLEDFDDKTFIDACFHILLNTELCYCTETILPMVCAYINCTLSLSLTSKHIVSASAA